MLDSFVVHSASRVECLGHTRQTGPAKGAHARPGEPRAGSGAAQAAVQDALFAGHAPARAIQKGI
eukprot:3006864-Heterocapsa_arctica.AAC.1